MAQIWLAGRVESCFNFAHRPPPFILKTASDGGFFFVEKPSLRAVLHFICVLLERWCALFFLTFSAFSHAF
jgi:hypothetical protein